MKTIQLFLACSLVALSAFASLVEDRLSSITIDHLGFFHTPFSQAFSQLKTSVNQESPEKPVDFFLRLGSGSEDTMPPVTLTIRHQSAKQAVEAFAEANKLSCRYVGNAVIMTIETKTPVDKKTGPGDASLGAGDNSETLTIHLADGTTLENCKLIRVDADGVVIDNGAGYTRIPPTNLSAQDQIKFKCNAEEYRTRTMIANSRDFIRKNFHTTRDGKQGQVAFFANGTSISDNFVIYFTLEKGHAPHLWLRTNYKGSETINYSDIIILVDSKHRVVLEVPFDNKKIDYGIDRTSVYVHGGSPLGGVHGREYSYSIPKNIPYTKEWADLHILRARLDSIKSAQSIQVRLSGDKNKDFSLTAGQNQAVKQVLTAYDILAALNKKDPSGDLVKMLFQR